jgi:hypothetical protein
LKTGGKVARLLDIGGSFIEDAKGAKNEKQPDEVVLGGLCAFARDLSFSYTKINRVPARASDA